MSELFAWDESSMNHQGNPGGSTQCFLAWQTWTSGLETGAGTGNSQSLSLSPSYLDAGHFITEMSVQNGSVDLVIPHSEFTQHFHRT